MSKVFYFDQTKCSGCHSCQIGCKDEHVGNDWMPYARPQPLTGQFWCKLEEHVRGNMPQVRVEYYPVMCQHCEDAPCIDACENKAIHQRDDGLVIIDPKKCTGRQACVAACPYDAIYFNTELRLAQKCTGCAHLLDRGWPIDKPRCVDSCIENALDFGERTEFPLANAEIWPVNFGPDLETRVFYSKIPKRFIAGTVYDPGNDEVVIGGTCTVSGDGSGTATTDKFGDFWIEDLPVGNFSLTINAAGQTKTIDDISTEKDVGLGYIELEGGSTANPAVVYPPPLKEMIEPEEQDPIPSPDGKVQLNSYRYWDADFMGMLVVKIWGVVENLTDEALTVKVTIDFINMDGSVTETQSEVVELSGQKGATASYEIFSGGIENQPRYPDWDSNQFEASVEVIGLQKKYRC